MNHVCGYCQKEFSSTSKKSRFCSLPCSYKKINAERKEKLREEYYANPRLCESCHGPLSFEQKNVKNAKYCSQSCAATMTNKLRNGCVNGRSNKQSKVFRSGKFARTELECFYCKKHFIGKALSKFCSHVCSMEARRDKKYDEFLKNLLSKQANPQTIKKCLIRRDGEQCSLCAQKPHHNGKFLCLQVDHIDGNSDNNRSDNVRLLCPNCHTQTETYCGGNAFSMRNKYRQKWRKE